MDYVQKTIQAYDADPDKYSSATDKMVNELEMNKMTELMPGNSKRILDVGCGPGRDASVFFNKGHSVVGIDISEELLKKARQLHPELKFEFMDVRNLDFEDRCFGAVWCNAVLLHLKDKDLRQAFKEIYRVMLPGGVTAVSFKEGEGEKEVIETFSTNLSRFYNYKTQATLNNLMEECGFTIIESYIINERKRFGSYGRDINWIWTIAKKPQDENK